MAIGRGIARLGAAGDAGREVKVGIRCIRQTRGGVAGSARDAHVAGVPRTIGCTTRNNRRGFVHLDGVRGTTRVACVIFAGGVKVSVPSPDEVDEVVQLQRSMPTPPALSVQFQFTVTSVLFQPAPLAAGDWVGAAVGGIASSGVQEVAPAGDV